MSKTNRSSIQTLAMLAMLLALQIILSRWLSIPTSITKIGFSFVPIAIALRYYNIPSGILVAGLGDFIGAMLFPIGPYYIGFTITAIVRAFLLGVFISKKISLPRIIMGVVSTEILCSLVMNTFYCSILWGDGFIALLPSRLAQAAVMTPVQIFVLYFVLIKSDNLFRKLTSIKKN